MAPRQLYYDQMAIQKKRNPSTNDRVPDLIKEGEILCDVTKRKWRLGKSIGMGAFGDIYLGKITFLNFYLTDIQKVFSFVF